MAEDNPISSSLSEEELSQYSKYLTQVRKVFFTIGFNRSGSSLVGDLLAAHPNIVISNEAGALRRYVKGEFATRESFLFFIFKCDIARRRKNFVADQYQCRYDCDIEVIGDKHSPNNTIALINKDFDTLEKLEALIDLPIQFIFTVRNPYDMISSMVNNIPDWEISNEEKMAKAISYFTKCCKKNLELLGRLPKDSLFMLRNEDFIATPQPILADLCDFLEVYETPDYIENCAAATYKAPHKSRDALDWNAQYREQVDALIEKYEFFNGYSWES